MGDLRKVSFRLIFNPGRVHLEARGKGILEDDRQSQ